MAEGQTVHPVALTPQRHRVLGAIDDFHKANGYAPSTREIQAAAGFSNVSSVAAHLDALRDQGLVKWKNGSPRTITITKSGHRAIVIAHG